MNHHSPTPFPARGNYVNLIPDAHGNLLLILTPLGKATSADLAKYRNKLNARFFLAMLIDDHLEQGWEFISPDEIGAETSAPLIGTGIKHDDDFNILKVDYLYWFPDYAVCDEVEELLAKGEVTFKRFPQTDTDSDSSRIPV